MQRWPTLSPGDHALISALYLSGMIGAAIGVRLGIRTAQVFHSLRTFTKTPRRAPGPRPHGCPSTQPFREVNHLFTERQRRNSEIDARIDAGETQAEVARGLGVSAALVWQVAHRYDTHRRLTERQWALKKRTRTAIYPGSLRAGGMARQE